jgi:TRAP-type C4-dicarboxylate transport system substrate-binding protein
MNRRNLLRASGALSLGMLSTSMSWAQASTTLKISHQFPGGTIAEGDFRDRLVRTFAAEADKRSKGALRFEVYPGSSLMKTNAQFSSMRKGALDMALIPLSYAGGEVPELNIGLMPGLVVSYEQAYGWKTKPVGQELAKLLQQKGIVLVSWIWQAGGVASRTKPIVDPEDAKGLKIRGGSREMDLILKDAGAAVVSLPSNEIYAAMQTGAMDAAMTSSTSFISFRLEEVAKSLTTGRRGAYWFMFEPLMMSKAIFDTLSPSQRDIIMAVGAEMEAFALQGAKKDDQDVATVYQRAGATVVDLSQASIRKWQDIARRTAWKDYGAKSEGCARLLALAEQTLATPGK